MKNKMKKYIMFITILILLLIGFIKLLTMMPVGMALGVSFLVILITVTVVTDEKRGNDQ